MKAFHPSLSPFSRGGVLAAALSAGLLFGAARPAHAQEADPVLDLLVKHHVISDQEAEKARADIEKEESSEPASKFNIATPVTELKIYGDIRQRFAINEAGATNDSGPGGVNPKSGRDHSQVDRFRLRLRLGAEWHLTDNWLVGVRLETSNDPRSTNVTEGQVPAFGKANAVSGTFISGVTSGKAVTVVTPTTETVVTSVKAGVATSGKAVASVKTTTGTVLTATKTSSAITAVNYGYTAFFGQLYMQYKPAPWLTLTAGKMPNPLITTPMTWDPDINPEGFAEQVRFTIRPFGDPDDSKAGDGKSGVVAKSWKDDFSIDLFSNLGQFDYADNNPNNSFGVLGGADGTPTADKSDTFLLAWQVGAKVNFSKTVSLQVAPTFYNYTGHTTSLSTSNFQGDGPQVIPSTGSTPALFVGFNQTGINDLAVIDIPAELDFQLFKLPLSVFGDFAINIDAHDRAKKAGHPDQGDQNTAYQVGASVGSLKKKGNWLIKAYYQQSDQYALDPNLVDNDVFDGRLNMNGPVVTAAYNFTDSVTGAFSYNYAQRSDSAVGTGGPSNAFALDPLHNYSFYYFDLIVKF